MIAIGLIIWIFSFLYLTEPLDVSEFGNREKWIYLHGYGLIGGLMYLIFDCTEGERNMRMARNVTTQVLASEHQRNIVIVGASHIIGLEKELKEKYLNLKVKLTYE